MEIIIISIAIIAMLFCVYLIINYKSKSAVILVPIFAGITLILSIIKIWELTQYNNINYIEVESKIKGKKVFCQIKMNRQQELTLYPYSEICINSKQVIEAFNLNELVKSDTINIAGNNYYLDSPLFERRWELLILKDLSFFSERKYTSLDISTNPLKKQTVFMVDNKGSLLDSEDNILLSVLPPEGMDFIPSLVTESLRFCVNDSTIHLLRGNERTLLKSLVGKYQYSIQSGDNLWTIAKKYNTTVEKLRKLNQLKNDNIRAGDEIWVETRRVYTLKNNDIFIIGDLNSPAYIFKMNLQNVFHENEDEIVTETITTESSIIELFVQNQNVESLDSSHAMLCRLSEDGEKVTESYPIYFDRKNRLINRQKLISSFPWFQRSVKPQEIIDRKHTKQINEVQKILYLKYYKDKLEQHDYLLPIVSSQLDSIKHTDRDQYKFLIKNKNYCEELEGKTVIPLVKLLRTPGLSLYLETDSLFYRRRLISNTDDWKIRSGKEVDYIKPATTYRANEFLQNPGYFITYPYPLYMQDELDNIELFYKFNFKTAGGELFRKLMICAVSDYEIIINGNHFKHRKFCFDYRDCNLFEIQDFYKFFINNLKSNNELIIILRYDPQKISVFNNPKFQLNYLLNEHSEQLDSSWEYATKLDYKNSSSKSVWKGGDWRNVIVDQNEHADEQSNLDNAILNENWDMTKDGDYVRFFRKLISAEPGSEIVIPKSVKTDELNFYIDGMKFDQSYRFDKPGEYILGLKLTRHYCHPFSKDSDMSKFITGKDNGDIRYSRRTLFHDEITMPIITDRDGVRNKIIVEQYSEIPDEYNIKTGKELYFSFENDHLGEVQKIKSRDTSTIIKFQMKDEDLYASFRNNDDQLILKYNNDNITKITETKFIEIGLIVSGDSIQIGNTKIGFCFETGIIAKNLIHGLSTSRQYFPDYSPSSLIGYKNFADGADIGLENSFYKIAKWNHNDELIVELTIDGEMQKSARGVLTEIVEKEKEIDREFIDTGAQQKINQIYAMQNYSAKQREEEINKVHKLKNYLQFSKNYTASILVANEKGEILVSCSYPAIEDYKENLRTDLYDYNMDGYGNSFTDINTRQSFYPGSSFKVLDVITLLGLEQITDYNDPRTDYINKIVKGFPSIANKNNLRNSKLLCPGNRTIYVDIKNFRDHECRPGTTLEEAFYRSLNNYFAYSMLHIYNCSIIDEKYFRPYAYIDVQNEQFNFPLISILKKLGFNQNHSLLTDSDFKSGIFEADFKVMESTIQNPIYAEHQVAQLAIGQNIVQMTPYQQILGLSLIANEDESVTYPYLINKVKKRSNNKTIYEAKEKRREILDDELDYRAIKQMMAKVAEERNNRYENGTAVHLYLDKINPQYKFYCKTGTADVGAYANLHHAWLIGFVEDLNNKGSRYYFACLFPYSQQEGSTVAGVAVRDFFEEILKSQ